MKAIDLFCGAGGLTRGLLDAGISVVVGVDVNLDCRKTYEFNNAPAVFLRADIRSLTSSTLRTWFLGQAKPFLLAGCAPCQPFSSHRRDASGDSNSRLLLEVGRLVQELMPEWVFIENVPGIARVPGFSSYRRFLNVLECAGYSFVEGVVDAKWYGVPQTRRRQIILASTICNPTLPPRSHGNDLTPYATVRDSISQYPRLRPGESNTEIPNHRAADISKLNRKRLAATRKNGGDWGSWPRSLQLKCHKQNRGHDDAYGRMKWDSPAPTLTCKCYSISNGRYGHPTQNRALSLREAARLQSFPDSYEFFGISLKSFGAQIGNAVPVSLACTVGKHILEMTKMTSYCA